MSKLLYIQASPRKDRSYSRAVADAFVEAYKKTHQGDEVVTLDIFRMDLPAFDGAALDAKYAIMHGKTHSPEEKTAWRSIEKVIEQFKSADKYVFAVPMWNFGIPYRLKQYFDVIAQPGYTFSFSATEGYKGLVAGKPVLVVYARGGAYGAGADIDLQKKYMELVLGFIGFKDIRSIIVEPTLAEGPDAAAKKRETAIAEAKKQAQKY